MPCPSPSALEFHPKAVPKPKIHQIRKTLSTLPLHPKTLSLKRHHHQSHVYDERALQAAKANIPSLPKKEAQLWAQTYMTMTRDPTDPTIRRKKPSFPLFPARELLAKIQDPVRVCAQILVSGLDVISNLTILPTTMLGKQHEQPPHSSSQQKFARFVDCASGHQNPIRPKPQTQGVTLSPPWLLALNQVMAHRGLRNLVDVATNTEDTQKTFQKRHENIIISTCLIHLSWN
ncbi:MAG: hypothetical protein Q9195_004639 [Heterodermia aff. obscurata]